MTATPVQPCCYISCDKRAEWSAYPYGNPYGETAACSDHLGHLLDPSKEHTVLPLWMTPLSDALPASAQGLATVEQV